MPDPIEAINQQCRSSYANPEFKENGYCFFFRDFLPTYNDTSLIGIALAWPENGRELPREQRRHFACATGMDNAEEYTAGGVFSVDPTRSATIDWQLEEDMVGRCVALKNRAMTILRNYVSCVVSGTGQSV